ncbi:choline-sulfatase [Conexibacter arvalis]|uniref:Choline-sulfatase n=2 Tax=Conexibacter arvalis TaxID=912552 RepID=A0A840IHZ4_9ACTN|nr:choline-sulfatase [Conexibacter arvalis]
MADEYRFPPAYESAATRAFRSRHLTAEETLRDSGLEFNSHYIMTAACAPSRTSFFTGQYPPLHGVSQTDGIAKGAADSDMHWLDPDTVPTLGDYFRAGGYETYYKGKWHVSHADLTTPGTHQSLPSYDQRGRRDPRAERTYLRANRLDGYGFDGWIGPEPHGDDPLNSGSSARGAGGRDAQYAGQTVDLLRALSKRRGQQAPWLVVSSFVNPHDIAAWGSFTKRLPDWNLTGQLEGTDVPSDLFDEAMYAATSREDLRGKPTCQRSYVATYPKMLQPSPNTLEYQRFYYQLMQNVNREIQKVLDQLAADPQMAADTIVIFTSDHGDMLGAHGGMHQKWHQAYEETTHVPFIVHNPRLFSGRQRADVLTSHADVLPTLLGLAGLNEGKLRGKLERTHTEVHPLVGRDLSKFILGKAGAATVDDPVYFMTDDDPSQGEHQVSISRRMYESVVQPNHVETIVTQLRTGPGGALETWKYSRYYDTEQYWSDPGSGGGRGRDGGKDVVTLLRGNVERRGGKAAVTTVKRRPAREQFEAYNLARDPLELDNLVHSRDPAVRVTLTRLGRTLKQQRAAKRKTPSTGSVPGQAKP